MDGFVILVNMCDNYGDCWSPFFLKKVSIYWPEYKRKIYLNSKCENILYRGLNIISVRGYVEKRDVNKAPRSECLKQALDIIDDEIILYVRCRLFPERLCKKLNCREVRSNRDHEDSHRIYLNDQAVVAEKAAGVVFARV